MLIGCWKMAKAKGIPKTNWVRKSNCPGGPGTHPGNKYNFSSYLKKIGDFVETMPMTPEECEKCRYAVLIWAYRKHCRVKTEKFYYPDGDSLMIEVISHTRYERNSRR